MPASPPKQQPSTGLRSRKKDLTRRTLLEAADRLFHAKGYEATTLEEICEQSGISLRTFFRYFESKRDLALYENLKNITRLRDLLSRKLPSDAVVDELEALYDFMAIEFEQDDKARSRLLLMAAEPSLVGRSLTLDLSSEARVAAALAGGGDPASMLDAQLVATMLVGGVRHAVSDWAQHRGRGSLRDAIAALFARVRQSGLIPGSRSPRV